MPGQVVLHRPNQGTEEGSEEVTDTMVPAYYREGRDTYSPASTNGERRAMAATILANMQAQPETYSRRTRAFWLGVCRSLRGA